ncbi:MAG: Ferrichrome-iron receptor [Chromatiales bacterium USCg_Taylor]|nr:MAG: Ferrichrome-iron receptor [Chromatiales bacterium USCg_Taylor]
MIQLEDIVVTGTSLPAAGSLNLDEPSQVGSRLNVPIKDLPASVEIINQATIQKQGSRTILEAIERAAGMSNITTPGDGAAAFSSRGFTGNNAVMQLYNGTRFFVGASTFTLPLDTWHLDRVEVLRGPASVLYGEGAIGGAINLVSKRPTKEAREYEALASYGSWDTVRLGLGSGGSVADKLFYRIDLSRQSSEGFVDRADYERWTFGSSLLYELTDRFSITLSLDYWKNDDAAYFGTPFINGRIDPRTRKTNYNILDSKGVYEDYWTRLELDWKVTNNLELHNETYAYVADRHWRNLENYAFVPSTGLINRTGFLEIIHDQTQIGDRFHALINHDLFGRNNRFLLGFDVNSIDFERPTNDFSGSSDVDPFNPNLGRFLDFTGTAVPKQKSTTDQFSLFAEDTLEVWDPLKLVAGFRFEHMELNSRNIIEGTSFEQEFNPVSWRVGFVYEPVAGLSLYAQRSTGVDPVSSLISLRESRRDFGLSSGRQYELGLKHSFWQNRVEWTFAYFDIVKEDLLTTDPRDPARTIQIGEQSSDGIELTAAIHPLSNLTLSGNFSRLNAQFDEFSEDIGGVAVSRAGNLPPNVPETLGNLWLYYAPASHIDLGVGARYVGQRVADNANSIELDAYTTVDIFATWKYKWGALSVRGRNLSDEQYAIAPYNDGTQVILADPRSYEVALQVNL